MEQVLLLIRTKSVGRGVITKHRSAIPYYILHRAGGKSENLNWIQGSVNTRSFDETGFASNLDKSGGGVCNCPTDSAGSVANLRSKCTISRKIPL